MSPPQLDQELRHISASHLAQLSTIIDEAKAWKGLLNELSIPLNLTLESIHRIKRQQNCDKSPTLALLNHWAISRRRRPTVKDLIGYLRTCQLARAEDFVWREILKSPGSNLPYNHTNDIQARHNEPLQIAFKDGELRIGDEYRFQDLSNVISNITEHCPCYSFESIYMSTNRFCHRAYDSETQSGARVGDGRFSSVFLAKTFIETLHKSERDQPSPTVVAAKLLKSECNLKYLVNEINLARKINHDNILELQGISVGLDEDGQSRFMCLIYPYMQNGSLLDCLKNGLRCNRRQHIPWCRRVSMATQVARSIDYLHNHPTGVIVHRDIKTANILIDLDLKPKLGDFTLVRQLESAIPGETQHSQNVIGTSVYMPPEAFRGDISTKFDIFSFGIVMLELLTGMRPFNEETNEDLLTCISDRLADIEEDLNGDQSTSEDRSEKFLYEIIDRRAGDWDGEVSKVVFKLALKATESRKRDRPDTKEILGVLDKLLDAI